MKSHRTLYPEHGTLNPVKIHLDGDFTRATTGGAFRLEGDADAPARHRTISARPRAVRRTLSCQPAFRSGLLGQARNAASVSHGTPGLGDCRLGRTGVNNFAVQRGGWCGSKGNSSTRWCASSAGVRMRWQGGRAGGRCWRGDHLLVPGIGEKAVVDAVRLQRGSPRDRTSLEIEGKGARPSCN